MISVSLPVYKSRLTAESWPALKQALLIVPVFGATEVAALIGLGAVARLAFIGGALVLAIHYWRRSPWLYLTLVFWFWTVTPLARRLIDYSNGFDAKNIVLVTPNLLSLFILATLLRSRKFASQSEAAGAVCVTLAIFYGLAVSLLHGELFAGAVGILDWLAPVLYYFYVLEHAGRVGEAEADLRSFLIINGLFVTGYGLVQVIQQPAWDAAWEVASGFVGLRELNDAAAFRPFSTLNLNGTLAFWLATLIVLSLHFRNLLSFILIPAEALLLLMTNARSVLGGALVTIVFASLIGGPRISRGLLTIGGAAVLVAISFGSLNPALVDRLAARFASVSDLQDDDSALTRAVIWRSTPELMDAAPGAYRKGAIGRGAALSNNSDLVSVDFGVLAAYLSLGWIFGTLYLAGLVFTVGLAILRAQRARTPAGVACAAASLGMLLLMFVVNVIGLSGAIMWVFAGFAIAFSASTSSIDKTLKPDGVRLKIPSSPSS